MISFLESVTHELIEKYQSNFKNLVVVLPSQRACLFLKKNVIASLGSKTTVLPEFVGIESFISELSGLQSCDNETLLLLFYEAYLKVHPEEQKKDFESFMSWGQILLQDFNEIDRYLVNHEQFFNYLYYIKDQRHWFLQENKTELIENYIQFWQQLASYYQSFVSVLVHKGIGYQGLQYRKASENIEAHANKTNNHYLFVGFNALNEAEQHIFKSLQGNKQATIIWDADRYFVNDNNHDASYFLKKHIRVWKNKELLNESLHSCFQQPKEINITGIPKNVGQVKYVGQLLSKLSTSELANTAVVLADENLLLPLLNSLPPNVTNVNITMGQPLSKIPLTNFIDHLFALKLSEKDNGFYYKDVIMLFQHHALQELLPDGVATKIISQITANNVVYITKQQLTESIPNNLNKVFECLFSSWSSNGIFLKEVIYLLEYLSAKFKNIEDKAQEYYCNKLIAVISQMIELVTVNEHINTLKALIQLYNLKLNTETIDFKGEPFEGLQIMGVLESRCLDFENIIITSVNEGTLPSGQKGNSFIPYDLKIEANLPTFKEKDAIYAYHFYRLLQRCKTAHLIYNTQVDELNSGEKSRFLQQLELQPHPNHTTLSNIITTESVNNFVTIQQIDKDQTVLDQLKKLAQSGFSPSALATYLRDPLLYYERYILGVQESDQIEEEVAANTLGTIIHEVLCNFYTPLEGRIVHEQDIKSMLNRLDSEVSKEFQKNYSDIQITYGVNLLSYEAAKQFLNKFLQNELKDIQGGNELVIVSVEKKYKTSIKIDALDFPIYIKGTVDRVDRYNGKLRIVDYKTGYVDAAKLKIKDWDALHTDEGYSKALQILMYAYCYCQENNITETVEAGIVAFKKLNQGFLPFGQPEGKKLNKEINQEVFDSFLTQLELLITEICDLNKPFISNELKN